MKTLLWIATIVAFIISWWWYVCPHKQVCPFGNYAVHVPSADMAADKTNPATEAKEEGSEINLGPLVFDWSSAEAITSAEFPRFKDSLLSLLGETDKLEILGGYFNDEDNTTSFPDLGMARATATRQLFADLPDARFDLRSAELTRDPGSARSLPFLATIVRPIVNNNAVREVDGKMVINFPHASDEMLDNVELNQYLDRLVAQLKTTSQKVQLVGHTDSTASADRNMRLGQKRADAIKNLLVRKGISSDRIITQSKGETTPIATNNTDAGRQQNRRVELTVID